MKTNHLIVALATTALLLTGCFTSHKGTKGSNTVLATEDPFKETDEVTINFRKMKAHDWQYPLEDAKLISPFGGKRPNHKGSDIKTKAKDKVRAAFKGVVTFSGQMSGYGNVVFISHPTGLETRYAHNSKNLVKKGEKVKPGDVNCPRRTNGQRHHPTRTFRNTHRRHCLRQRTHLRPQKA